MSKEKNFLDEKSLIGRVIDVHCKDRNETAFTGVELKCINEAGLVVTWESRGCFFTTHIPSANLSFLTAKYNNNSTTPSESKAV
ncbi:MAG: hypothetical protein AB7O96_15995 [Pseudobdellovibrionaceae bacterium]